MKKLATLILTVASMTIMSCGKDEVKPDYNNDKYKVEVVLGKVKVNAVMINTSTSMELTQGQFYYYDRENYKSFDVSCMGTCVYKVNGHEFSTKQYFKF